jgi:uncharacterized protein
MIENLTKVLFYKELILMIGWASEDIPWFTQNEKKASLNARDDLINQISPVCQTSAKRSLYHLGKLSKACKACIDGKWACIYLTNHCTRNCFFCPQPNHKNPPHLIPYAENFKFSDIDQVLLYLEKLDIQSVSFSGGEPLLRQDLLLSYISAIRQAFGRTMYIWLNTNGDLVDNAIMKDLANAGLDEIRIDLGASHYRLDPVETALEHDVIVSVETPAIPEDIEHFKNILVPLKQMGLNHVILNQIYMNQHNYKSLSRHPYHAVGTTPPVIFESEMMALELVKYTIEQEIDLPLLYCSDIYKNRFQSMGRRQQALEALKERRFDQTTLGYLREIQLFGPKKMIQKVSNDLRQKKISEKLWLVNNPENILIINSSILDEIHYSPFYSLVTYYDIELNQTKNASHPFAIEKQEIFRTHVLPGKWIKSWYHYFVTRDWDKKAVTKHLYQSAPDLSENTVRRIQKFIKELDHIRRYEVLEEGLQAY